MTQPRTPRPSPPRAEGRGTLDVARLRGDFPILAQRVHGQPLAYLDSASTSHKPRCVLDAVQRFYAESNANVHRGLHALSEQATAQLEAARQTVRRFLGARSAAEIVFVRGATEAINLVAQSWGRSRLQRGDEVVLTQMEHHSNIVPWQMLRDQIGVVLKVAPIDDRGELLLEDFERCLGPRTKLVAACHVSNALGTVNPVEHLTAAAHARGIPVLLDGAQAAPHLPVDVRALDCDFYTFSGHKAYGPTGIGALYAKAPLLEEMPPYQGGGEMIREVSFERTLFAEPPLKFEAGTPHIAGAIGLAAALDWLEGLGWPAVRQHEDALLARAAARLAAVAGATILGAPKQRAGVLSFVLRGLHAHDLAAILDQQGIAIRSGHHCAMPVMERFGVDAAARMSLAVYNTDEEVDRLIEAVAALAGSPPR